jgi:hypothetical protein
MAAAAGEILDTVGAGIGVTSIVMALEVAVPGLLTVMESVPTDVSSAAGRMSDN